MKNVIIIVLLLVIGAGGAFFYLNSKNKTEQVANDKKSDISKHGATPEDFCNEHKILEKDCPWCDKKIIAARGQCEHAMPKALCIQCNPKLIDGFKAEKDWCGGHNLPESQCKKCQGNDLPADEIKK
jgi:hypothetical protein